MQQVIGLIIETTKVEEVGRSVAEVECRRLVGYRRGRADTRTQRDRASAGAGSKRAENVDGFYHRLSV
jgi:hypothetical protein